MLETVSLDNALNEKKVVSDAPYILAKTSNGDTVKISKADLASVVAGQMYKGELRSVEAFNSAITHGRYMYSGSIPPSELGTNVYGVVEVIPANTYISQVIYGMKMISFRISFDKGINWSAWTSVGV